MGWIDSYMKGKHGETQESELFNNIESSQEVVCR